MLKKKLSIINAAFIAVVALTAILYWSGLDGPFILDDKSSIEGVYIDNPDWDALLYTITHNSSGLLGRSITIMTFMLTEWQFGLSAWGYKFHNLLLHLANGLLIYRFLYKLLPILEPTRLKNTSLTAGVVTSFWLIHPLLVSTVLYSVQRMVELAVFFSLLSLLSYLQARTRSNADVKFFIYAWILFPLNLLLAILSKETGVLIPIFVLTIEFIAFKTTLRSLAQQRHILCWLLVFVLIPIAVACLYLTTHFAELTDYSTRTFTLSQRLLTQLHVLAYYSRAILVPRISEMSLFQDDFPLTQDLDISTLILVAVLLLTLATIWLLRQRAPIISFGLAWFLGAHLLESTFLPLELVFEHRNYLAAIGLLLPPIYYVIQIQSKEYQRLRWFLAALFVIFVGQTYSRVQEWSDIGVMLTVAVNDHPASGRARIEYANYLYGEYRLDEAIDQLAITVEMNPQDGGFVLHQLIFLCIDGRRDEALLAEAQKRLRTWPVSVYALNAMNRLLGSVINGECKQLVLSDIESLITASLIQPGNIRHDRNHSTLIGFLGIIKFIQGSYEEGVELFDNAYRLNSDTLTLSQLFRYQMRYQEYDDAEETLRLIEQLNKKHFGIETYTVNQLNKSLSDARKAPTSDVEQTSQ